MTFKLNVNLDDEQECARFLSRFPPHPIDSRLARKLGFSGRGSHLAARSLWNYAVNRKVAFDLRRTGRIDRALKYEGICDRIYRTRILNKVECW